MRGIFVVLGLATIALVLTANRVAADGEDCFDEGLNLNIKRGETIYPKDHCIRMTCTEEGKIHPEPCMMAIPPGCHIVMGDQTKKWPGCCPSYACDEK